MFPTVKDKIVDVKKYCESQGKLGDGEMPRSPSFLPTIELEKIVKLETTARNRFRSSYMTGGSVGITDRSHF